MKKLLLLIIISLISAICYSKITRFVPSDFYYEVKKIEYEKGIPSQATFAISVIETGWWKSNLCKNHNNYFGISNAKGKGRGFNSMYECLDKYVYLITQKSYYRNAYANRNNCNDFIDNMVYWNPSREKYTNTLKYIADKYEFIPETEYKDMELIEVRENEKNIALEIFEWVCNNIEYDYITYFDSKTANNNLDYILTTKKAQCKGYAELYKKLCENKGLKCEVVEGLYKYREYQTGDPITIANKHFWNVVFYSGKWHLVDCALGSGYMTNREWVKNYDKYYFDPDPGEFQNTHFPLSNTYQLSKKKINIDQFQYKTPDFWYFVKLSDFISPEGAEDCLKMCENKYTFDFKMIYEKGIYNIGAGFYMNRQQAFWIRDYFTNEGFIKPEVIRVRKKVNLIYK